MEFSAHYQHGPQCAACEFWTGPRQASHFRNKAEAEYDAKGQCVNAGRSGVCESVAQTTCGGGKVWSAILPSGQFQHGSTTMGSPSLESDEQETAKYLYERDQEWRKANGLPYGQPMPVMGGGSGGGCGGGSCPNPFAALFGLAAFLYALCLCIMVYVLGQDLYLHEPVNLYGVANFFKVMATSLVVLPVLWFVQKRT